MRIGYAKIGRSIPLSRSKWGFVGGDDEPMLVLQTLARRHPEHEFVIVGKSQDVVLGAEDGYPSNVYNGWNDVRDEIRAVTKGIKSPLPADKKTWITTEYRRIVQPMFQSLDGLVVWTGQHGTSNNPIPMVGKGWDDITSPQDAFVYYGSYLTSGINMFRRDDPLSKEEVWLCPDARNYVKARDLKWPIRQPVLGQYAYSRMEKHERWGDTRTPQECGFEAEWEGDHVWKARYHYSYSRLEICGVTPEHMNTDYSDDWAGRGSFGLFINEARSYVSDNRADALVDWVYPLDPTFVHGQWPKASLEKLSERMGREIDIKPASFEEYYDKLRSVRTSFTTPTSGTGWATTKPWQSFATGTVMFSHPTYDTQGNVIPTLKQVQEGKVDHDPDLKLLASWLRVESPESLKHRVETLSQDEDTWRYLARVQRRLYDEACTKMDYLHTIEKRLGLRDTSAEPWTAEGTLA